MTQVEFDYYIAPNVVINDDGSIDDMTDVYSFDDRDTFFLYDFTGWGMPSIDYITQQGPYQHGVTVLDYRLQPRTIQLTHRKIACNRQGYWDDRYSLVDKLRPNHQLPNTFGPGRLRKTLPDGSIRDIKVLIEQGPTFAPRSRDAWDEYSFTETLRFIAHNPIIFNPAVQSQSWTSEQLNHWVLPWSFPSEFIFGSSILSETVNVAYTGNWLSYPTIYITGPIQNPIINNNTTNEKIELNYNVPAGVTIIINLEYGLKTVVDSLGNNLIGVLTTDSDLATFHIAPYPEAPMGVNSLTASGTGAAAFSTSITIKWYINDIGT
jgi:hypothetical protein